MASQYQKLRKNKLDIMRSLDLLVIDEISMVRADVLDAIDAVLRRARRSQKPFGGVQLLMIGDVHQLAPVAKPEEWEILAPYYQSVYFFGSHVLQNTTYLCVELDHIYRQHDEEFITLLNKVRDNRMDAECLRLLNQRYQPYFTPSDNEGYITLTTHNYQADDINDSKLQALPTPSIVFKAETKGIFPENTYPTKETLELKVGAQVMFVKNDPSAAKAFFNGKIGKVVSIDKEKEMAEVQCADERLTVTKLEWQNTEYAINAENQNIEEKEIGSFKQSCRTREHRRGRLSNSFVALLFLAVEFHVVDVVLDGFLELLHFVAKRVDVLLAFALLLFVLYVLHNFSSMP